MDDVAQSARAAAEALSIISNRTHQLALTVRRIAALSMTDDDRVLVERECRTLATMDTKPWDDALAGMRALEDRIRGAAR
jgi:hypothetical protein